MTFRLPHLLAAAILHVVVLGLLFGGVQCSRKVQQPPVISAVLLDPSRAEQAKRTRDDQRRRAEAERKQREEQARRQREAEQRKKAEQQKRLQAEADAKKKKDAEALRQKQLADKKAADQKVAAEKKLAEQKAAAQRAAEQKKQADEAARLKREQEEAERATAAARQAEERRMEQALQEEAATREAEAAERARAETARQQQLAEWATALTRHVQRNYRTPPGAPEDFSCQVHMQLLPDGTVSNAKIVKSCGSAILDRAVEDAVHRSSPMPKPADPDVFDRDLTIIFTP